MRNIRNAVLAGALALVAIGAAVAASHDTHVMKVRMPDGSVAHIAYQGDVAPKVSVVPMAMPGLPEALFEPFAMPTAIEMAPFAALDRVAAQMDREMNAIMQKVSAPDGKLDMASFGTLPAGTMQYRFVSTSTGNGTCSRSVQMTSAGDGQQPKVVQTSTGDCKGMPNLTPTVTNGAVAETKPQPVKAKAKLVVPVPATI